MVDSFAPIAKAARTGACLGKSRVHYTNKNSWHAPTGEGARRSMDN
jgi:hypothetical protein